MFRGAYTIARSFRTSKLASNSIFEFAASRYCNTHPTTSGDNQLDDADSFGNLDENRFAEKSATPKRSSKEPSLERSRANEIINVSSERQNYSSENRGSKFKSAKSMKHKKRNISSKHGKQKIDPGDVFGTLEDNFSSGALEQSYDLRDIGRRRPYEKSDADDEAEKWDEEEMEFIPAGPRHPPQYYYDQCKRLAKEGKLAECVAMLEKRMLKHDRVPPKAFNFNIVIQALGNAGHSKKAFQLYNQMTSRAVIPTKTTYVGLWNSCANSEEREEALERAAHLLNKLDEQGYPLSEEHYNVLIKCFAKHRDLDTASKIADRMLDSGFRASGQTFAQMMFGCISRKSDGLALAIQYWREMIRCGITPQVHHYNLLLRTCRDCDLGGTEKAESLFLEPANPLALDGSDRRNFDEIKQTETVKKSPSSEKSCSASSGKSFPLDNSEMTYIERASQEAESIEVLNHSKSNQAQQEANSEFEESFELAEKYSSSTQLSSQKAMSTKPEAREWTLTYRNYVLNPDYEPVPETLPNMSYINSPRQRFTVLGGQSAILSLMQKHNAKPDAKTFTLILFLINVKRVDLESQLLEYAEGIGAELDYGFYHQLIRNRCTRKDMVGALKVVKLMSQKGLEPTETTFGNLATGCDMRVQARQLLQDMETFGLKPNKIILGALLQRALNKMKFGYARDVIVAFQKHDIKPDKWFLSYTEDRLERARQIIKRSENPSAGRDWSFFGYLQSDEFWTQYNKFNEAYQKWLLSTTVVKNENPTKRLESQISTIKTEDLQEEWEKPRKTEIKYP